MTPTPTRLIPASARDSVERYPTLLRLEQTEKGALIGGQATTLGQPVKKRFYSGDLAKYTTLTSAGSYRVIPGLASNWLGTRFKSTVISQQTYQRLRDEIPELRTHPHVRYLVVADLPAGADLSGIRHSIIDMLPQHQWKEGDIQIITEASNIPTRRGLSLFVRTELHYLVFAGLLGASTIVISLLGQARPLLWSLEAKGLRPKRRFLLASAMGLSPILLGLLTGTLTGILAGYVWTVQSTDPCVPITPTVALGTDFAAVSLVSLGVFTGMVLVTSYWFTKRAGRTQPVADLSKDLGVYG